MRYGIRVIVAGIILCKKKNKNELEERAIKAFKKMIIAGFIPVLAYVVIVAFWLVPGLMRSINGGQSIFESYVQRTGHVEEGQVRYVQNVNKYISLDELNISIEDVQEGDDVTLFFDTVTDELLFGKTTKEYERQINIALGALLGSIIVFVICYLINAIIGKKCYYEDFEVWYKKQDID
jgi:hypothetical protein